MRIIIYHTCVTRDETVGDRYMSARSPNLPSQAKASRSATSSRDRGTVRYPTDILDPLFYLCDLLIEFTGGTINPLEAFEVVAEDQGDLSHWILC